MSWMKKLLFLTFMFAVNLTAGEQVLRLATTTSTYETGLLDCIIPPFEKSFSVKVHVISAGTGKAIRIGQDGEVDVILVHSRKAEDRFVEDGFGVGRKDVMSNDFIIIGPKDDPAGVRGMSDAAEAMKKIAASACMFVSRGDDSGTHSREKQLWAKAGLMPAGGQYLEAGQGMTATAHLADEKNAYVLIDRATYLSIKDKLRLVTSVEGDDALLNNYGIIAVNPARHKHVKYELAMAFINWITSRECRKLINNYEKHGSRLFHAAETQAVQEP